MVWWIPGVLGDTGSSDSEKAKSAEKARAQQMRWLRRHLREVVNLEQLMELSTEALGRVGLHLMEFRRRDEEYG